MPGYKNTIWVQLVPRGVRKAAWFNDKCITVASLAPSSDNFEDRLAEVVSEAEMKCAMLNAV